MKLVTECKKCHLKLSIRLADDADPTELGEIKCPKCGSIMPPLEKVVG
jgi:Zn finger protein HypA/HybF involved in hydrogenase expression